MVFLDGLRKYLERLHSSEPTFTPDIAAHRRHLIEALEKVERQGESKKLLTEMHQLWSNCLVRFVEAMGDKLSESLAYGKSHKEITSLINIAISSWLGIRSTLKSKARDLELKRLTDETLDAIGVWDDTLTTSTLQYALEIRAVRRSTSDKGRDITPIGRLVLELPERDALRWVLSVEAVQSRGLSDPWRISRTSAANLLRTPEKTLLLGSNELPATLETLFRLSEMGLLETYSSEKGVVNYRVLPDGRPFLEEVATGHDTPFTLLVEALLQDETFAAIGQARPSAAGLPGEGAAALTARHARMVAHEIRNALVPVHGTLDTLYRDAERKGEGALLEKHRPLIDGGIERIFRFVEDMVSVAERGAEPPELFDVAPAVEDALAAVASELGRSVPFERDGTLPPVTGTRSRFVLAVLNLLRNAAQAKTDEATEIRIAARAAPSGSEVIVTVDDSGPGVAAEHRVAIFERGFSLRQGGTGQGLALVREVVESEMRGRAACEQSPLGGARFVLMLPVSGRKSR